MSLLLFAFQGLPLVTWVLPPITAHHPHCLPLLPSNPSCRQPDWLGCASWNPKDKQGLGTWLPAFESLLWCEKSIVAHKHASFKTEKAEDMLVGGSFLSLVVGPVFLELHQSRQD